MSLLFSSTLLAAPTVDGFFSPGEGYQILGTADAGNAKVYYYRSSNRLYLLVRVDPGFNDNAFGDKLGDDAIYLSTAGWGSKKHDFKKLQQSDQVTISVSSGGTEYKWQHDYIDGDFGNWTSGISGDAGKWLSANTWNNTTELITASSLQWNLTPSMHPDSTWDMTLSGTRTTTSNYRSPSLEVHPEVTGNTGAFQSFDDDNNWEWAMIYEMSFPIDWVDGYLPNIMVYPAHNSPSKVTEENIYFTAVGDYVWEDSNQDGIQNDGLGSGISGVTVELHASDGTLLGTKTTNSDGLYIFNNLSSGNYYIKFFPPSGYQFTSQDQGGNDATDSDANPTTGLTATFSLTAPGSDMTWDAGLYKTATLGDYVWEDEDKDGEQDEAASKGINGVTVNLYQAGSSTILDTDYTANDASSNPGYYEFTSLEPGDYVVEFIKPTGYSFTTANASGVADAVDSDADETTGKTTTITLSSGETDKTWDAGLYKTATLGDYAWNDVDLDGLQDANENGIAGVTVNLYRAGTNQSITNSSGSELVPKSAMKSYLSLKTLSNSSSMPVLTSGPPFKTTTTNAQGKYLFDNLDAGQYIVEFLKPQGYDYTTKRNEGSDDQVDSDVDILTGKTETINLQAGVKDTTWDAGYYLLAQFGDFVWIDVNEDGIQDQNELGMEGVTIYLFKDNCNSIPDENEDGPPIDTTTTDASGYYKFTDLVPGKYFLKFVLPSNFTFSPINTTNDNDDSDANENTGLTDIIFLNPGDNDTRWDAGIYEPPLLGSIGNFVWEDENKDGIQDPDELGINNILVELYKVNGGQPTFFKNMLTKNHPAYGTPGYYLFTDLEKGKYMLKFGLKSQYIFTTKDVGGNVGSHDYVDSDAASDGTTTTIHLPEGKIDLTWDAGMYRRFIPNPGEGRRWILARYQPWYGDAADDSTLRYWNPFYWGGHADTSLFAFYSTSTDEDMYESQILLGWACGIDGFAVDWYGKKAYENMGMKGLLDKADQLYNKYHHYGFNFEIATSYNEFAKDSLDTNFIYIGDFLMTHPAYWGTRRHVGRPLFLFDYKEDTIYTADEYRACGDTTLPPDYFLLWNGTQEEVFQPVDVCYEWINSTWGLDWGEEHIDTTYWRENYLAQPSDLAFALGFVWPGQNDLEWVKGLNHFMDRQDTLVYEETWAMVHEYNYPLPMPWCYIETWNDYNQASEIEPSLEHDYKFNVLTRDNARIFKGSLPPDSVGVENLGLLVPQHVLQARKAAKIRINEASIITQYIDMALDSFFVRNHLVALSLADKAAGIAPEPFKVVAVGDTSITLTWEPAVHANNYNIYFSRKADRFEPCSFDKPEMISVGNVTEYVLTGLRPNTDYTIAVTASDTLLGPYANDSWYENTLTGAKIKKVKTTNTGIIVYTTDVTDDGRLIPKKFDLLQNYPNPFNATTVIEYHLPKPQHATVKIYDIQGREIMTLVDEEKRAGISRETVDTNTLASGIYFFRLLTPEFTQRKKMMLIK